MMESISAAAPETPERIGASRQIVTFWLGDASYGLDIRSVREIKAWMPTTSLPNTPAFVRGVANLRGMIVPILDLGARFGRDVVQPTQTHVVIIVAVDNRFVGLLVDAVSDITTIAVDDIMPVPEFDKSNSRGCLDGIVSIGGQLVTLISGDRVISPSALN